MKKFPTAKAVSWGKESNTEWEAEFKMDNTSYSANFDMDGNWKETEHEVDVNAIPRVVKNALDQEYSYYKIKEAEISENESGTAYKFEIQSSNLNIEVSILPEGRITQKQSTEEKNENHTD